MKRLLSSYWMGMTAIANFIALGIFLIIALAAIVTWQDNQKRSSTAHGMRLFFNGVEVTNMFTIPFEWTQPEVAERIVRPVSSMRIEVDLGTHDDASLNLWEFPFDFAPEAKDGSSNMESPANEQP